jgi:hypothetical protein
MNHARSNVMRVSSPRREGQEEKADTVAARYSIPDSLVEARRGAAAEVRCTRINRTIVEEIRESAMSSRTIMRSDGDKRCVVAAIGLN